MSGRQARKRTPLESQARWLASTDGRDAVALLEEHARELDQDLVPLRFGRMLGSRLAFLAGANAVMASDLATRPDSGLRAQLCGDAHIDNFAWFLRPDGHVFFGIDHFDETASGPWEWDLKRLATSLEVAGRDRRLGERQRSGLVSAAVDTYCDAIRDLASREYLALATSDGGEESPPHMATTAFRRAVRLAAHRGQGFHLVNSPPAIVTFADAMDTEDRAAATTELKSDIATFRRSLREDYRQVLDRFIFADAARKIDDLSDIGRTTLLVLFVSRDRGEPLVLEVKEAGPSVLSTQVRADRKTHAGRRVVEGRRLIDPVGDMMLGWFTGRGWYGVTHDYHVRQSWPRFVPSHARIDVHALLPRARAAARTIAQAHARSGDRVAIATYIGRGDAFTAAIVSFAVAYADQNEFDYEALKAAVERGRIVARGS